MAQQNPAHTEVAHESAGHGGFPPFNAQTFGSQIVWLAIAFGLLYLLMSRVALPRVAGVLGQRRDTIGAQLDAAAVMQAQAKAASDAQEKSIAEARGKAQALAKEARDALASEADTRRKTLEAELAARLAAAETQIGETTARAMANVDSIATEAAAAIVERLSGKPAAPDAIARAIAAVKQG